MNAGGLLQNREVRSQRYARSSTRIYRASNAELTGRSTLGTYLTHTACARLDLGGLCPHCDQPVAISDIIDKHQ